MIKLPGPVRRFMPSSDKSVRSAELPISNESRENDPNELEDGIILDKEMERNGKDSKGKEKKKPDPFDVAVNNYNVSYTAMSDAGHSLLRQRERSADLISLVEHLVNSIARTPKSFEVDLGKSSEYKQKIYDLEKFAVEEIDSARQGAVGAAAGFLAGASTASIAPAAAMWTATTFGTASTGTAISTLSGAAANQAALAWLGGGAVAAGGGGTAAGNALLALAGPIGWTVAGTLMFTSVGLYFKNKRKIRKQKNLEITEIKDRTAKLEKLNAEITALHDQTRLIRTELHNAYVRSIPLYGSDFTGLGSEEQDSLAALVNNTLSCAQLLGETVSEVTSDG